MEEDRKDVREFLEDRERCVLKKSIKEKVIIIDQLKFEVIVKLMNK